MLYQSGDERLSLYEMNSAATRLSGLSEIRVVAGHKMWLGSDLGFNITAWQDGDHRFVVVGSAPMNRLLQTVSGSHG